jgi:hypothetical protein
MKRPAFSSYLAKNGAFRADGATVRQPREWLPFIN